ncbi:MAG: hypothetical protein ACI8WT_001738 [Clostridium sp.]|jgi:hypothetical protein
MNKNSGGWTSKEKRIERDLKSGVNTFECLDHSKLIKKEYLNEYEDKLQFFIEKVIYLNMDLYIMDKVINYPFELFGNGHWFFSQVSNNFYDIDVLTICKLVSDSGYTISKFKDDIEELYLKEEYKKEYSTYTSNHNFDKILKEVKKIKKIKFIRNKVIAHTDVKIFKSIKIYYQGYKKIRNICNDLNTLIEILDFGVKIQFLPSEYMDGKSDIENILCLLAKDSVIFKELEKYPERKQILDNEDIAKLNIYREKFNLKKL